MSKLLEWLGLEANKEERYILDILDKNALPSMRIIGRGTLTMDAIEARSTDSSKELIKNIKKMSLEETKKEKEAV